MNRLVLVLVLFLLPGCVKKKPDYFPLTNGARRSMRIYSRRIVGSDTSETTRVRLVSVVQGKKQLPGIGLVWVIEVPRDSGRPSHVYFRKKKDEIVQIVFSKGRKPVKLHYLSLPLSQGDHWYDTESERELFEVVAKETVKLRAGTFPDCYKISVVSTTSNQATLEWFAPDVGPVKWKSRAVWFKDGVRHELVRSAVLVRYQVPAE
ncbi:hypothetical protein CH330_02905 [candidate division WOR-3 bacterium JGI_Cruoil_03_51_56]|uniref:DUF3108 domain-containing protein n=2 Tax=candidate division WOR-3 bacterium JGI_Cruoil_03_51_56 TaxID=1973747 RepID=A0A235BWC3_UNCW3|nr:MAG: hypothetical protein CH330_02905 [candidate division WOR-3 bacterium JGI_Cruoil_03_51_56]